MSLDTWSGLPASSADSVETDLWLGRVMQSAKNKAMIARLEHSLRDFVQDSSQTHLPFPPRSAFHRKVCYLVARRYGLDHRLEQHSDPSVPAPARGESVCLVLIKTPHSGAPVNSLASLAEASVPATEKDAGNVAGQEPAKQGGKVEIGEEEAQRGAQPMGTTFLRRPRTADGKGGRAMRGGAGGGNGGSVATLKNSSEEDYRKIRARIFKNPEASADGFVPGTEQIAADEQARIVKIGVIAKGPIQGSTGFDRRRNRCSAPAQATLNVPDEDLDSSTVGGVDDFAAGGGAVEVAKSQGPQGQQRGSRESRSSQETNPRRVTFAAVPVRSAADEVCSRFASSAPRRLPAYPLNHYVQSDRQDPDFDRRYDKWAVRREEHLQHHQPQQVPVPVFSQLLYPYAVQGATPHLHPPSVHMSTVSAQGGQMQQGALNQFHSMQHQHPQSGSMMFQQVSQGFGGMAADHEGRHMNIREHLTYDTPGMGHLGASHSREMSALQHQSMPPVVARKPSPAYGLDSTVDFPPLP